MYSKLKGLMVEKKITQQQLAQILEMSITTLNFKINGKSDFNVKEAKKVSNFFGKTLDETFYIDEINKTKANI